MGCLSCQETPPCVSSRLSLVREGGPVAGQIGIVGAAGRLRLALRRVQAPRLRRASAAQAPGRGRALWAQVRPRLLRLRPMMHDDPIALVGGVRTAIGRFGGALKDVDASDLGAACIRDLIARVGIDPGEVDEVVMGQVAQVGPDAYNARRCALGAGLPPSSTAMNVNRLCSSGLQAIVSGAQSILSGQARVVVAGGDESMSRQPFLTYGERAGWRLGSREAIDGTLSLLTDPFGGYQMGVTAEKVAEQQDVSRERAGCVRAAQPGASRGGHRGRPVQRADRRDRGSASGRALHTRRASRAPPRWSSSPVSSPSSRRADRSRPETPRASTTAPPR